MNTPSPLHRLLGTIYSPTASVVDRHAATAYLESIVSDPNSLTPILSTLTEEGSSIGGERYNEDNMIMFGVLSLLDRWRQRHFPSTPLHFQMQTRESVISVLVAQLPTASREVVAKMSKILAGIAVQQYPHIWPGFISDVLTLWAQGSVVVAYACTQMLLNVLEDCIDSDFSTSLSSARRQEILAALQKQAEELVTFSFNYVSACYARTDSAFFAVITKETVKMYIPLVTFLKAEVLCRPPHDISLLTLTFLESRLYQQDALDLLLAITQSRLPYELYLGLLQALPTLQYAQPSDEYEVLEFHKKLTEAMHALLSENIAEVYMTTTTTKTPSSGSSVRVLGEALVVPLVTYLGVLLNLLKHPSRRLALSALTHWLKILKEDVFLSIPNIDAYLSSLTAVFVDRMARMRWGADGEALDAGDALDFESREDFAEVYGTLRSKGREWARVVVPRHPGRILGYALERLQQMLAVTRAEITDYRGADGKGTTNSTSYLQWEVYGYLLDILCKELHSIGGTVKLSVELSQIIVQICEILLSVNPSDFLLLNEKINCLEHIGPLLHSKVHIQAIFSYLFSLMPPPMNTSTAPLPTSTTSPLYLVASKACAALSVLAERCASVLRECNLIVWCCTEAQQWLSLPSSSSPLSDHQHTALTELILVLSTQLASADDRMQVLQSALGSRVSLLNSPETRALFGSPSSLLEACCSSHSGPHHQASVLVGRVKSTLSSLLSISRKVAHVDIPTDWWSSTNTLSMNKSYSMRDICSHFPFAKVWEAVTESLVMMLSCLHSVCEPQFRMQCLHKGVGYIYLHSSCFANSSSTDSTEDSAEVAVETEENRARRCAAELFESLCHTVYQLLGQAAVHKALYVHPAHSALVSLMSASVTYLDNHVFTKLLKLFVEQYVLHAIPAFYATIAPAIGQIMSNLQTRLTIASCPQQVLVGGGTTTNIVGQQSDEERLFVFLYGQCGILPRVIAGPERLEVVRNDIVYGLSRAAIDTFTAFFGLRGLLAIAAVTKQHATEESSNSTGTGGGGGGSGGKSKAKVKAKKQQQSTSTSTSMVVVEETAQRVQEEGVKKQRLACIEQLLFSEQCGILDSFLNCVTILAGFADAYTCRKAIKVIDILTARCLHDTRFVTPLCRDAFHTVLFVILRQEAWSVGIEGDIIDLITALYCLGAFGELTSCPTPLPPSTSAGGYGSGGSGGGTVANITTRELSAAPLQILSSLPLMTAELSNQLNRSLQTEKGQKRRREVMKDFIQDELVRVGSGRGAAGGIFADTLYGGAQERLAKAKKGAIESQQQQSKTNALDNIDLSLLFWDPAI